MMNPDTATVVFAAALPLIGLATVLLLRRLDNRIRTTFRCIRCGRRKPRYELVFTTAHDSQMCKACRES